MTYEFSKAKIARWVEKIGAHIRPPIEIDLEGHHIQEFSKWARDTYPQLFDRMVLGVQRFEMLKTLDYPGKPAADVVTYAMTQRGPLLVVPRRISEIDLEPDLPKINEVFVQCMEKFLREFYGRRVIRVGKINEYVFDCEQIPSVTLVAQRFVKIKIPEDGEINVRFNLPDSKFNRIFTIGPLVGQRRGAASATLETIGFGVNVTVDLNNRTVDKEMDKADWGMVLHSSDAYNEKEIYSVLNCSQEETE